MSIEDYLSHFAVGDVLDIQLDTELGGTVVKFPKGVHVD
jgi:hypothetical protein